SLYDRLPRRRKNLCLIEAAVALRVRQLKSRRAKPARVPWDIHRAGRGRRGDADENVVADGVASRNKGAIADEAARANTHATDLDKTVVDALPANQAGVCQKAVFANIQKVRVNVRDGRNLG